MKHLLVIVLINMFLTACNSTQPAAMPTVSQVPTETQEPTQTPTPEATARPTENPKPKENPIDLPIVRNFEINKFQSLPYVSPEDALSPAFNAFLDKQEAAGNLGDFPDVRYLVGYEFGTDRWQVSPKPWQMTNAEKDGLLGGIIQVSDNDFSNRTFADPIRKPEYNQAYFKTKINNTDYLLFVSEVLNKDNSRVRIKYVLRYDKAREQWSKLFDPSLKNHITIPVQYFGTTPNPQMYDVSDKNYFNNYWQVHEKEMKALIEKMQTGNMQFTPDFGNFLWGVSAIPTTY